MNQILPKNRINIFNSYDKKDHRIELMCPDS